jgi:glutathione synthase/RimK-type ligase-like ATP-grasp enzyme
VAEFRHWVDQVSRQAPLWNPAEMVRWNLDKHYLADLSELGLPVVPSRFLEPGEGLSLIECITETGWEEGVIKPCVASAARLTYRVDRRSAAHVDDLLKEARSREAFLFQPFLRDVIDAGEITLVAFDGRVTHAVRKRPRPGDFRVQDDHGGTVHPHTPTEEEVELAELTLAEAARSLQQPDLPLYGRVDLVRDSSGAPRIMELEWIEPELWLRMFPTAAQAFADGIARRLDRREPPSVQSANAFRADSVPRSVPRG